MARRKKPEDETPEQTHTRHIRENIANHATRSEKTSWNRLMDNMVSLLATLKPIEDKILELQAEKIPILDDIQALRTAMVKECVHPYDQLILKSDVVECKFCYRRFLSKTETQG